MKTRFFKMEYFTSCNICCNSLHVYKISGLSIFLEYAHGTPDMPYSWRLDFKKKEPLWRLYCVGALVYCNGK